MSEFHLVYDLFDVSPVRVDIPAAGTSVRIAVCSVPSEAARSVNKTQTPLDFRAVNQKILVTRLTNPLYIYHSLSIQWNSIRLGGHAHGIGTQTVHETLPASIFLSV